MSTYQKTKQKSNNSSQKQSSPPKRSATLSMETPALAHERTPVGPNLLTGSEVLRLQRTIGNQAVSRLLMRQDDVPSSRRIAQGTALGLQAKSKVNAPDDAYEQEAKGVAETAAEASKPVSPETERQIENLKGGGVPLPQETRLFFERRMGAKFAHVRIHTDGNAIEASRAIKARAFTVGNNIAFNAGEYAPDTDKGRHLLAHELTHVVQQTGGSVSHE